MLPVAVFGRSSSICDLARELVGGQSLAAEADQLVGRGRPAALERDERLDGLAAIGVGHAHQRRLTHGRVLVKDVLHLARPRLVAAGVDLVLLAVDEVKPAALVHEPNVAGAQLAAGQRVRRFLGLFPSRRPWARGGGC
jgi:hypothetical protein